MPEEIERRLREQLTEHYQRQGYFDVAGAVEGSLSIDNAALRLGRLHAALPQDFGYAEAPILVSGMGTASEMLAARRIGFDQIVGTEVDAFSVDLCKLRLSRESGFQALHVPGPVLPFAAGNFGVVLSGHVIEHTADPASYIAEHLRVLVPGGYFYLEFPTRYHHTELHTRLPSLEWLPLPLRNAILRQVGYGRLAFAEETKRKCRVILETGLKPVSVGMVRRWAKRGASARVSGQGRAESGVVFVLLRKP